VNVLILGAAVSGTAAAHLARRLGYGVEVYDEQVAALGSLRAEGLVVHSGPWSARLIEGVDLVITSPGIPETAAPIVDTLTAGIPLWSEMEFGARHLDAPCVAVTGTNGKTTVANATAAMLEHTGVKVCAAGNIGTALSSVVGESWDVVVVEASSFQLRFTEAFHPVAAALLNVAPDHLDWHGTEAAYAAAKARIYVNQTPQDILVFDADDPGAVAAVAGAGSTTVPISGRRLPTGGNGVDGDVVVIGDIELPRPDLDVSYLSDLVAAGTLARHVGADPDGVGTVLSSFEPGPHRRTVVGRWDGVTWVDDSKATNPHAAVAAASAYRDVVLIAGGRNKGLDLAPLVAVPSVRHIFALGEAAHELVAAAPARVTVVDSMEAAVEAADQLAAPGTTVLLAPGCASFDMFRSYGERGDRFRRLVVEQRGVDDGQ
jgi:UDP-N-acetylmuramoylalanine--D-glutamate ligase